MLVTPSGLGRPPWRHVDHRQHTDAYHSTGYERVLACDCGAASEKGLWLEALKPLQFGSTVFDVITRYVPTAVLQRFASHGDHKPPAMDEFEGSILFSDISGFTKLSGQLMNTMGVQGSEELNRVINNFFDLMITAIFDRGGDVIKFMGDAMFVVWHANADPPSKQRRGELGCAPRPRHS